MTNKKDQTPKNDVVKVDENPLAGLKEGGYNNLVPRTKHTFVMVVEDTPEALENRINKLFATNHFLGGSLVVANNKLYQPMVKEEVVYVPREEANSSD